MEIYNIGLVIEGGGMRGIFSAGVLDYLMERFFCDQAFGKAPIVE